MLKSALSACFAIAASVFATSAMGSEGLSYEDNKLNFRNCQGENVTARWFGTDLSLSRAGTSPSDPQPTIDYLTWSGECAKMGWNTKEASFATASAGVSAVTSMIRYIAWDGAKWAATRTGPGFYVSRIAKGEHAAISKAHFADAAKWLRRRDPNNTGAMTLIDALNEAAAE